MCVLIKIRLDYHQSFDCGLSTGDPKKSHKSETQIGDFYCPSCPSLWSQPCGSLLEGAPPPTLSPVTWGNSSWYRFRVPLALSSLFYQIWFALLHPASRSPSSQHSSTPEDPSFWCGPDFPSSSQQSICPSPSLFFSDTHWLAESVFSG